MLMGDLVLLEAEVGPVLAKLQEGGIEQTALHTHLLHESPHVMYMHIGGHGTPVKLAAAVHAGLALTGTPLGAAPAAPPAASLGIDTAQIGQILGFQDRKSTRLNSSHLVISYAVFCLKKKKKTDTTSNLR